MPDLRREEARTAEAATKAPNIIGAAGRVPGLAPFLLASGAVRTFGKDTAVAEFEREIRGKRP